MSTLVLANEDMLPSLGSVEVLLSSKKRYCTIKKSLNITFRDGRLVYLSERQV